MTTTAQLLEPITSHRTHPRRSAVRRSRCGFNDGGNANDGYVDLPEGDQSEPDTDLFMNGSYTIATWVKIEARSSSEGAAKIVGNYQTGGNYRHNYLLRVFQGDRTDGSQNKIAFIARDKSDNTVTLADDKVPTIDEWVHYAATFDSSDGTTTLFRNGSVVDTAILSNFDGFDATAQVASLSDADSESHQDSENFNGLLDDVRIYDEALTQSEIQALTIPEPSALALLLLCGVAMLRRRRA